MYDTGPYGILVMTWRQIFDLSIQFSLDQCRNFWYNVVMATFNSFEELVQSTQNQPLDVSSNPNGTVTPGAVQPPASIPPSGRDGAKAGGDDTPPEWHKQLAQKVTGIDGRLTTLEKKVDDGFVGIRTEMNQKFTQVSQQFTKVGQALDEIKKRLPQK
jgi:hypothetical protein